MIQATDRDEDMASWQCSACLRGGRVAWSHGFHLEATQVDWRLFSRALWSSAELPTMLGHSLEGLQPKPDDSTYPRWRRPMTRWRSAG